jgi:hypothetical protein
MADPEVQGAQVEYEGNPVPLARPNPYSLQIEYRYLPLNSGVIGPVSGVVETLFSKSTQAGIILTSRVAPADLLAFSEVSTNSNFDAESKWSFLIVQYIHDASGQKLTSRHRKVGADWDDPYFFFPTTIHTGSFRKRAVIIVAKTGDELVLLPGNFGDGERITIVS